MKTNVKNVVVAFSLFTSVGVMAQGNLEASLSREVPTLTSENTPSVTSTAPKEVTILLKNVSEKKIVIFAGAKEDIRSPRIQEYGGMSSNKLYLKENEVVCLMTVEKKPMSCAVIKPGVATVEVNSSASVIVSK
jgi:hypothetical protein